jgi:protein phosphatase
LAVTPRTLSIPELALVLLVGASGSGKSTFAHRHFRTTEILSSDFFRGMVADDETDQSATGDAFDVLHYVLDKRLGAGRLTVVDATNVLPESRKPLVQLARRHHVLPVAIVFDVPERLCHERNRLRPDRTFGPGVIRRHIQALRRSLGSFAKEGIRPAHVLSSVEEIDSANVVRQPMWSNLKTNRGPFDIIGDVHGCYDELIALLERLGYQIQEPRNPTSDGEYVVRHSEGRQVVFLGDLVDRGPRIPDVLRLVMDMVASGTALCLPGNHEMKLLRKLRGHNVQITHGLAETLEQLEAQPPEFRGRVADFIDDRVNHYVLDDGKLVVAHAGLKGEMHGRASGAVHSFALYGETTGETDEFGLPVRGQWAAGYRGRATVVYGHTPVFAPEWLNNTINVDTGCVFGGKLTALRYPEKELVSVAAARTYYEPARPLTPVTPPALSAQQELDDLLDIDDVLGRRSVTTRLMPNIVIPEEHAVAALEVMSRFAVNPKWLIYLPPTMSPCETSQAPGLLEHPTEALEYFARQGIRRVICQEKHMGSRAVVVVCRDADVARRRFGVVDEGPGVIYTRTGRRFFDSPTTREMEGDVLARVRDAMDASRLWERLETDWICLDCELMPWSAKAQGLILEQYAPVGAVARAALDETVAAFERAADAGVAVDDMLERLRGRAEMATRYVDAYRHYVWPVTNAGDLRLAPFHILATEGAVHADKDHLWHMEQIAALSRADEKRLQATAHRVVDLDDDCSRAAVVAWWESLTAGGGEGMVVKPLDFVARSDRGLVQPAIKCRGPEYLRIIYGPEYRAPEHLERLRSRGLGAKRSLALREFALGLEALERFVRREPLRRVHKCVFGVLALESEPVDPRL